MTEATNPSLTISGQARGADRVKVTIGDRVETVAVVDGRYSLPVAGQDLVANKTHQVTVELGQKRASQAYTVDPWAVAQLSVTGLEDQVGDLVRISGHLAVDGTIYAKYRNLERIEELSLTLNKQTYAVGVQAGRFTFDIKRSDLEAAKGQAFTISQDGRDNLYDLEVSGTTGTLKPVPALFNLLTADNLVFDVNPYLEKGRVKADLPAQTSRVTGQAGGLARPDDLVVVRLGDQTFEGRLDHQGSFAIDLPTEALRANRSLRADLHTHNAKGEAIRVGLDQVYGPGRELDGTFKMTSDQSNPDRPYFVRALSDNDPKVSGYGHLQKEPFAYDKTRELTYSFNQRAGTVDVAINDVNRQVAREAFDKFSHYANVTFKQVPDNTEEEAVVKALPENKGKAPEELTWSDIQFFLTRRFSGNYAVYGGPVFYLPQRTDWDHPNFKRTFHHELFHSFGAKHAHEGASNEVLPPVEDQNTLTVMTYRGSRMNADITDIHLYDLIYLHFRYGVNPKTRAGNDVYSFKDFDIQRTDANIYVWDGGGVDTFDASQETTGVTVDLTPGSWIHRGAKTDTFAIKDNLKYTTTNFFEGSGLETVKDLGSGFLTPDAESYTEFHNSQAFIGYGTQIERLIGSSHADTLRGNGVANDIFGGSGADTISGGAGDDYLDGGAGADQMDGGDGNDTFIVDDLGDRVAEAAGQGQDLVISSVNFDLPEHVEDLTLTGLAQTGRGNAANNRITGNSVANRLTGGSGADTFVFNTPLNGQIDEITDFGADDTIELSSSIFDNVDRARVLEYIIYDSQTGSLSYDPDGKGQTDKIQFAQLPRGLTLRPAQIRWS